MIHKDLEQIKTDLETEGFKPGTDQYNYQFLERKVNICQQKHGVSMCGSCPYFEECDLSRSYLLAKFYRIKPPAAP